MQKFRPSGKVPFLSLILMLLAVIVGGAVIGGIVAFVHQYFYLVLAFPILMGALGGYLLSAIVRSGKVRSPIMAVLFGVLIGLVSYGVYRYGAYYLDRQKIVSQLATEQDASIEDAQTAFDLGLKRSIGATGFIGYEELVAKQGITFTNTTYGATSTGPSIQGNLVFGYWALEILIIVVAAGAIASQQARKPFCENCGTWYAGKARIGSVDRKSSGQFVNLLKDGRFSEAKAMYIPPSNPPRTDLEMDFCKTCQTSDVVVTAKKLVRTSRNRVNSSVATQGVVDRQQLTDLLPVATSGQSTAK